VCEGTPELDVLNIFASADASIALMSDVDLAGGLLDSGVLYASPAGP
jgi:hypothetical protein